LIDEGQVFHRILPVLSEIPPLGGESIHLAVFVHGRFREGKSSNFLFEKLVSQSRATPFLLAHDGEKVLIVGLAPAPKAKSQGKVPALEVLREFLQDIEVVREAIDSLLPAVNHRYDHLIE